MRKLKQWSKSVLLIRRECIFDQFFLYVFIMDLKRVNILITSKIKKTYMNFIHASYMFAFDVSCHNLRFLWNYRLLI